LVKIETLKMKKQFAVTDNYDVVLSTCSGGKDSFVSSFLASHFVDPEKLYILYYSSPWDFPGTRELVEKFCVERGLNLIVTAPNVDINKFCVSYGPPNQRSRWCIWKIKADPTRKVIAQFPDKKILFVDGSRREESYQRRNIPLFEEKRFNDRDVLHPIFDWSEKRVWTVMRSFCLPIHSVYRWSNRLSCFCCPLQTDSAWLSLRRFHPDLFEQALKLERECGKPFRRGYQFLKDLEAPQIKTGLREPRKMSLRFDRRRLSLLTSCNFEGLE